MLTVFRGERIDSQLIRWPLKQHELAPEFFALNGGYGVAVTSARS
jgi:hypothetical protein